MIHAAGGVHHEHGEVGHAEGGIHLACEVKGAGGIQQVDLVVFPLKRYERCDLRAARLLLFGREVADRVAGFHIADAVEHAGSVEHGFGERGLAAAGRTDKHDIAYFL